MNLYGELSELRSRLDAILRHPETFNAKDSVNDALVGLLQTAYAEQSEQLEKLEAERNDLLGQVETSRLALDVLKSEANYWKREARSVRQEAKELKEALDKANERELNARWEANRMKDAKDKAEQSLADARRELDALSLNNLEGQNESNS